MCHTVGARARTGREGQMWGPVVREPLHQNDNNWDLLGVGGGHYKELPFSLLQMSGLFGFFIMSTQCLHPWKLIVSSRFLYLGLSVTETNTTLTRPQRCAGTANDPLHEAPAVLWLQGDRCLPNATGGTHPWAWRHLCVDSWGMQWLPRGHPQPQHPFQPQAPRALGEKTADRKGEDALPSAGRPFGRNEGTGCCPKRPHSPMLRVVGDWAWGRSKGARRGDSLADWVYAMPRLSLHCDPSRIQSLAFSTQATLLDL